MRKIWLIFACFLLTVPIWAQNAAIEGHSFLGGTPAVTSGQKSTNYLNGIIPSATITVYLTGTTTLATIYSDAAGTPLSNPFTSNALGSTNPGGYLFFAAINQGYDIVANGGIAPNTYPQPVTLCTDCFAGSQITPANPLVLQHNGTNLSDQTLLNFDDTTPSANNAYPAEWAASSAYATGAVIECDGKEEYQYFQCTATTGGTSGTTYPTFNLTYGGTTTDGTVVWTNNGNLPAYQNIVYLPGSSGELAAYSSFFFPNDTTPAAPSGGINVQWQIDSNQEWSGYVPYISDCGTVLAPMLCISAPSAVPDGGAPTIKLEDFLNVPSGIISGQISIVSGGIQYQPTFVTFPDTPTNTVNDGVTYVDATGGNSILNLPPILGLGVENTTGGDEITIAKSDTTSNPVTIDAQSPSLIYGFPGSSEGVSSIALTKQFQYVTLLSFATTGASGSWIVIAASSGSSGVGTVTSVAQTVPSWLAVSGSPITSSGTLAISAATGQTANEFLATPNGSTGAVGLRAIVPADIPTLNQSTTGNAATATAFAATPPSCTTGEYVTGISANGTPTCATPSGGVSSVANSDGSLTISPTSGSVVASLNTAQANTWSAPQTFEGGVSMTTFSPGGVPTSWISMPTTGPSGIGSGTPGVNPWIAYAAYSSNWFSQSLAGDIAIRNSSPSAAILIGATNGGSNLTASFYENNLCLGERTCSKLLSVGTSSQFSVDSSGNVVAPALSVGGISVVPVADVSLAIAAGTQAANSCSTPATLTMTGLTTTMALNVGYSAQPTAGDGWSAPDVMQLQAWPSAAGTVSYQLCNNSASSESYGAITFTLGAH